MERFDEDSLRILRALRFASHFDFLIDPEVDNAIRIKLNLLEDLSRERVNSEFSKILTSPNNAYHILNEYHDVLFQFIPEFKDTYEFPQNHPYHKYDVFMHSINALKSYYESVQESNNRECDLVVALSILFHDIGKPHSYQDDEETGIRHFKGHVKISADITNDILKRLRFDKDTREKVVQLISYHDSEIPDVPKYVKRMLNKLGVEQYRRLLSVQLADIEAQNFKYYPDRYKKIQNVHEMVEEIVVLSTCFTLKQLSVNGTDLINLGINPGKEIGIILETLLDKVISNELKNDKDILLAFTKEEFSSMIIK